MTRLVEDLLLLARLDERAAGDAADTAIPLDIVPMDLRTLAADALHDLRALDPSRPIELTGPGGGHPASATTLGDERRLRQVMANLLANTAAHTPPGTPVRIGVGTVTDHAIIEVADAGPGLTPEQAAQAFDRFYRADTSRGRPADPRSGAGLGLSIVRSLVAAHNGHVDIETAPGEGATFRIALPSDPERAPE
jgi:two-component system OmpR family sensor kinase